MGQRLNIEIMYEGNVLANSYYHWDAYTRSSVELTKRVIQSLELEKNYNLNDKKDQYLFSIHLLETTGARLTKDEAQLVYELFAPERKYELATSRNDGLIAISEKGIEETRYWEEGRVTINLSNKTVIFSVISEYDRKDFIEYYGLEEYEGLPILVFDYSLDLIPFEKISDFEEKLNQLVENGFYGFKTDDSDEPTVYYLIE